MIQPKTGYLLGVNMQTGKLVYSDDPDIQRGDLITTRGYAVGDPEGNIIGGTSHAWYKVRDPEKIELGPNSFAAHCAVCHKSCQSPNFRMALKWDLQHRQGNHGAPPRP